MKRVLAFAIVLSSCFAAFAQENIIFYTLKGPSAIGAIKLFETPPSGGGVTFSAQALPGADLMVAKLLSGEAKIGILPPNVAAKLAAAGRPLMAAAVVGNGMLSLLSSDPSVLTIDDLKGRKIAVAGQGATPEYVFRKILAAKGLNNDKAVQLDFSLPYAEAALSVASGKIDLALLPEPFATMATAANPLLTLVSDIQTEWAALDASADYPMTVLVVDSQFASEYPAALSAFLEAYRVSITWVKDQPSAAGLLAEQYDLGLKAAIAAAAIPKSAYVFKTACEAKPALQDLFTLFLEYSPASIGGKLPEAGFYYSP